MAGRKPLTLVGREAEQAGLHSAWVAAQAGAARVVLVGGEAGIGKTALLGQFTAGLPDEALVLRGQCVDAGGRGLPYAPLIGVLSDLVRQVGREALIRLAGAWRADLGRLVPDLGPAAGDVEAGRSRLFQGVVSLLEQTASRQPVVLVVEDLHWADESTLELLRFAVRTLRDGRDVPQRRADASASAHTCDGRPGHPAASAAAWCG
jgi:predicted ATPase